MKRRVLQIAMVITGCMLLAGCDGAESPENSRGSYTATPTETEAVEAEPTEAGTENKPTEAASENITPGDGETQGGDEKPEPTAAQPRDERKEGYLEILKKYKEVQDDKSSIEELNDMGIYTYLGEHGWPYACNTDEVRYHYYDVDSDGEDELIISYYGDVIDIFAFDGSKVKMAYSAPYRSITELYPDGLLKCVNASRMDYSGTSWYQFDSDMGEYFYIICEYDYNNEVERYTSCYYDLSDSEREEILKTYKLYGDYPVWIGERGDDLTEEEYNDLIPKGDTVKLPHGELLADFVYPDQD